jgi:hypothetical protein
LPQPLTISDLLTLEVARRSAYACREAFAGRIPREIPLARLAGLIKRAAEGPQDVAVVSVALKMILSLRGRPVPVERRRFPGF